MPKGFNIGTPKKITQAFAGVAALTLVGGGGIIFLMSGRISAEHTREAKLSAQVGSSEDIAKRLQATQAAYNFTRSQIAFLETAVTEKSYVPTLLQQLQNLALTTSLSVTSVQPSPITTPAPPAGADKKKAPAPPYDTMDIDLHVVGSYADTVRFLYGLTHFPKVISVVSVQMSPGSGSSSPAGAKPTMPQVTTDLRMTAFVFHDDGSAAPATAAGATVTATAAGASVVPPIAAPTVFGAAGRAARGAVAATRAADMHSTNAVKAL